MCYFFSGIIGGILVLVSSSNENLKEEIKEELKKRSRRREKIIINIINTFYQAISLIRKYK